MPVWKWRRRPTRNFGNVWVPFAQIEIQTAEGRFQSFALQVDSGAIVSLLRRSVADLLGIQLEQGRKIQLSGVGGAHTTAFVHDLNIRFDSDIAPGPTPFAIAATESVPNLLGRLGVFDRLQVDFDASLAETRITAPWLDETGRRIWEFCLDVEGHILQRLDVIGLGDQAKEVVGDFLQRGAQLIATAAGMAKLHRTMDAFLVIRAFFELSAQFEYLMLAPEERASRFTDFGKVTKYKQLQLILKHPKWPLGKHMAEHPDRAAREPQIRADYEQVKPRFTRKGGKGVWDKWYCLPLRRLVEEIDKKSEHDWTVEYDYWYTHGSAWAHGDPFAIDRTGRAKQSIDGGTLLVFCFHYYARMLLGVSGNIVLTAEHFEFLKTEAAEFA